MIYCKNIMWVFWSFLIFNVASYSSSFFHCALWSIGVIARASASILHHEVEDHTSGRQWSRDPENPGSLLTMQWPREPWIFCLWTSLFYTFVFQVFVIHRNLGSDSTSNWMITMQLNIAVINLAEKKESKWNINSSLQGNHGTFNIEQWTLLDVSFKIYCKHF